MKYLFFRENASIPLRIRFIVPVGSRSWAEGKSGLLTGQKNHGNELLTTELEHLVIEGMEPETEGGVPFEGGGGGFEELIDFKQGCGEGREPVDPVEVGIEGEI